MMSLRGQLFGPKQSLLIQQIAHLHPWHRPHTPRSSRGRWQVCTERTKSP
jgi:hypothetical protein